MADADFLHSPSNYSYVPPPPLADWVAVMWLQTGYTPIHPKERVLPDGSVELIISLDADYVPVYEGQDDSRLHLVRDGLVMGAHAEHFVIDTAHPVTLLGVHFKPGGAFPFFGCPADEMQSQGVPLEYVWGGRANDLRGDLMATASPEAQFRLLEQFLVSQIASRQRHPAVTFAIEQFCTDPVRHTVAEVTAQIGLSSTRLTQLFRAQVGLTPKVFSRIQRFQRVIRQLENQRRVDWVGLALDCGYFDQAHFIHDFQAFAGLSPSTYVAQPGKRLNHVPMLDFLQYTPDPMVYAGVNTS